VKQRDRVTRIEIPASQITVCDTCCYGPLAWVRNANRKNVLAMVYPQPGGRFVANSLHAHLPRECARKIAEQELLHSIDEL
jgi:hypothetical protein